jgi:hypothetical protein
MMMHQASTVKRIASKPLIASGRAAHAELELGSLIDNAYFRGSYSIAPFRAVGSMVQPDL